MPSTQEDVTRERGNVAEWERRLADAKKKKLDAAVAICVEQKAVHEDLLAKALADFDGLPHPVPRAVPAPTPVQRPGFGSLARALLRKVVG
jgi:hypothetical protein